MIDLEELKKKAKEHLENFHPDSMPPMKIAPECLPSLIAEIERLQSEVQRLEAEANKNVPGGPFETLHEMWVAMGVDEGSIAGMEARIKWQDGKIAELEQENAALRHDIDRALDTSTALVNEVEELRGQIMKTIDYLEGSRTNREMRTNIFTTQDRLISDLKASLDAARAASQKGTQR